MNTTVKVGRERKVRCYVCHNNVPESRAEPIRVSPSIVKQACKEHGLESPHQGAMTGEEL